MHIGDICTRSVVTCRRDASVLEVARLMRDRHVGDLMLSMATEVGADLLVMGCYGHSRARELMLGGASRTVLRAMTIPVLMAH